MFTGHLKHFCGESNAGYGLCCGGGKQQAIYVAELLPYQPQNNRGLCLSLLTQRARIIFANADNDVNQDGWADRVNLMAYSMGARDALVASSQDTRDTIASITTIAGAFETSSVANAIMLDLQGAAPDEQDPPEYDEPGGPNWMISEFAHSAMALLDLKTPDDPNEVIERTSWLDEWDTEEATNYFKPGTFYQNFRGYGLPDQTFLQNLYSYLIAHESQSFDSLDGQDRDVEPETSAEDAYRIRFTRRYLNQLQSDAAANYIYGEPTQTGDIRELDLRAGSEQLTAAPQLGYTLSALWFGSLWKLGLLSATRPTDGLAATKDKSQFASARKDVHIPFGEMGSTANYTPWNASSDSVLHQRGVVPANHFELLGHSAWPSPLESTGVTHINPATGFDALCFWKTMLKELQAMQF